MNARIPLRIVSPHSRTAGVNVWGFRMEVEYDYDAGEAPIWSPIDRAHPGSPPNAQLLSCKVNGADITDMLSSDQRERIEEKLIEEMQ
jgi:hypothetical protein